MQFYIKNEAGEFVEASKEIDEEFHRRSHSIVATRLKELREKDLEEARPEFEKKVREETEGKIREEVNASLKNEYEAKLQEASNRATELDVKLRRKAIAAEFGFKPEAEEFLGSGTDEEMRAKADTLKTSFSAPANANTPEKTGANPQSKILQETGLNIVV